ncbi:lipopolysaccharide-induced tumor necrosis factor-alpha factor homolog isoform X1 [Gadus morhua]|uniref:lipopolysaccharide-induced tumor necrosis factor-alpha factor homolog isoform X1 n=1 Tax=Gadus morhua TaxID=8049 RepID=UPI0011B50A60|nr:lipopolysaccharide-induced tumor necrosis factor-alpha factor homolog isoform X1 [Gadus morhua]
MMNPAAVYPYPPGNPIGMPVYPQGMAQPPFAIPVQQQPAVAQNTAVNVNSPVATTSPGFVAAPIYQPGPAQPQFQSPVQQQPAVAQNTAVNVNSPVATTSPAAPIYQPGPAQPQFQSPVQPQPAVAQNTTVQVNAAPVQPQPVVQHTNICIDSGNLQGQPRGPELKNVVVVGPAAGERPVRTKCPLCEATCVTSVTYKNGALTWVLCGVLGILGIWPFCLIPLCCDSCKDVEHRCPNCQNVVHVHRRI